MARYIDADKLLKEPLRIEGHFDLPHGRAQNFSAIPDTVIMNFPTADVAPVVHGHWIFGEFNGIGRPIWCSECGNRTKNVADPKAWLNYPEHKYCGRCGAKMDGKKGID